jgi:plastocyanin
MKMLILSTLFTLGGALMAQAADINISQANQQFSEDAVKMSKGDTLLFHNADTVTHNIQVINSDGDTDDKGLQKPKETITEMLSTPGEYKVRCGIHPGMKLAVSVK